MFGVGELFPRQIERVQGRGSILLPYWAVKLLESDADCARALSQQFVSSSKTIRTSFSCSARCSMFGTLITNNSKTNQNSIYGSTNESVNTEGRWLNLTHDALGKPISIGMVLTQGMKHGLLTYS